VSSLKQTTMDPRRHCTECRNRMARRRVNGALEPMGDFLARTLCHMCERRANRPCHQHPPLDRSVISDPRRACQGADPNAFYPEDGERDHLDRMIDTAEKYCQACPILAACHDLGDRGREMGVWGGWLWISDRRSPSARHVDLLAAARQRRCERGVDPAEVLSQDEREQLVRRLAKRLTVPQIAAATKQTEYTVARILDRVQQERGAA